MATRRVTLLANRIRRSYAWRRFWWRVGWPCRLTQRDFMAGLFRQTQWRSVIVADICTYCTDAGTARNPMTREHIIPKSQGGGGLRLNTVGACTRCNHERGHKPLLHYLLWRRTGRPQNYEHWLRRVGWDGYVSLRKRASRRERRGSGQREAVALRVSLGEIARWR